MAIIASGAVLSAVQCYAKICRYMKSPQKIFVFLAVSLALWLSVMADASALTLGRARGAALLGQPLSLHVDAQFGPDEDATGACFEAEVHYGDIRQESGKVTVTMSPVTSGQAMSVHVLAAAKVDEPVVTVNLKAVCGQKTSRRYVLLADIASELAVPAAASPVQRSLAPAIATTTATLPLVAPVKSLATAAENSKPKAAARKKAVQNNLAQSGVTQSKRSSRLKLTPADVAPERDPALKSSNALAGNPVDDLQKRVEAVAAWQALNTTAQDVLQERARMQSMDADLKGLTELMSKNRKLLSDMATRVEQAEAQRYANPLVYGLIIFLVTCLVGLGLLWRRLRNSVDSATPWWRADAPAMRSEPPQPSPPPKILDRPPPMAPEVLAAKSPPATEIHTSAVDIDLDMGESVFSRLGHAVPVPERNVPGTAKRDFQQSGMGALRAINTREMLDVRQQAEFFMTLGQHGEAIRILESSINSSEDSNPMVYLDLLKVFHTLSRKTEFDRYRADFNLQFSGLVPEYAQFNSSGKGLDEYTGVCEQIATLWPDQEAVDFIERCLVRAADAPSNAGFDLEAFRDMLMLHGVARRMEDMVDSGLAPFSAPRSTISELVPLQTSAADADGSTTPLPIVSPNPDLSAALPVDLDLSEKANNLIDFDISGYTAGPETVPPKP